MDSKHKYHRLKKYKHEGNDNVVKVDAGKVFHVIEGRNAWHSTWIVQYQPNSFYSSLSAAKEYAESIRKSGSVFTVVEKPSLIIRSSRKTTIITELNNSDPLSGHLLGEDISSITNDILKDYRERTKFLPDFIKGMMVTSFGWLRKVADQDLLILQHGNPELETQEIIEPLKARSSKSHGADYALSWNESKIATSIKSVERLADNLENLIVGNALLNNNITTLDSKSTNKIRLLKSKIAEHFVENSQLDATTCQEYAEMFLQELKTAYTEASILSTKEKDIFFFSLDWLDSLKTYTSKDRKKILSSTAIGGNKMPFFQRTYIAVYKNNRH